MNIKNHSFAGLGQLCGEEGWNTGQNGCEKSFLKEERKGRDRWKKDFPADALTKAVKGAIIQSNQPRLRK